MRSPLTYGVAWQPYVPSPGSPGEPDRDLVARIRYKLGQISPRVQEQWNMAHGRHLAGFGGLNETQPPWDPDYKSDFMAELEKEDDVFGSGIFDAYGRQPTVNREMGVFGDHPSLPGFIDREVPFAVSRDIYDITSGADVVSVPAGGMTYQERGGLPVPFVWQGFKPLPPPRGLVPPTGVSQPYVSLLAPGSIPVVPPVPWMPSRSDVRSDVMVGVTGAPMLPYNPWAQPARDITSSRPSTPGTPTSVRPRPRRPHRQPVVTMRPLPSATPFSPVRPQPQALLTPSAVVPQPFQPLPLSTTPRPVPLVPLNPYPQPTRTPVAMPVPGTPFARMPLSVTSQPVRRESIVNSGVISTTFATPPPAQIPSSSAGNKPVPYRQIVTASSPTRAVVAARSVSGLGAEPEPPGWGTYMFAGLLVGGAAALFFGATKIKV